MKTPFLTACLGTLLVGAIPGVSIATPGDGQESSRVEIQDGVTAACPARSELCLTPGARSTVTVWGTSDGDRSTRDFFLKSNPPRFSRVATVAAHGPRAYSVDDSIPWTLALNANLRRRALAGNAVFLVYDLKNPTALATHEVTGAWQATIPAGDRLSAKLILSPTDGFRSGHTYRIQLVQIIRGKEMVLAEGNAQLL